VRAPQTWKILEANEVIFLGIKSRIWKVLMVRIARSTCTLGAEILRVASICSGVIWGMVLNGRIFQVTPGGTPYHQLESLCRPSQNRWVQAYSKSHNLAQYLYQKVNQGKGHSKRSLFRWEL